MYKYSAEDFTVTVAVEEFMAKFRNAEVIGGYCRRCENFGKSWGCPPFEYDVEKRLRQYKELLLVATKIIPEEQGLPVEEAQQLILPERRRLEKRLHEMENACNGLACTYIGRCLYCPEGVCTRLAGQPCRHPDKVRPSLEAYGFDVARATSEVFGLKICWSKAGKLPAYLILVCGLFYNPPLAENW